MSRLKTILISKTGNSIPFAIAIALAIVMVSTGVFEYMRLLIIANGVRDAVESSIIAVSVGNYDEVYSGLREGYSGGYELNNSAWRPKIDIGNVYSQLDSTMGLKQENGCHVKYAGERMEYKLSGLSVNVVNAPFAPTSEEEAKQFLAEANIYLEVPLSFGWDKLPEMKINLKLRAGYTAKF